MFLWYKWDHPKKTVKNSFSPPSIICQNMISHNLSSELNEQTWYHNSKGKH